MIVDSRVEPDDANTEGGGTSPSHGVFMLLFFFCSEPLDSSFGKLLVLLLWGKNRPVESSHSPTVSSILRA